MERYTPSNATEKHYIPTARRTTAISLARNAGNENMLISKN